MSVKKLLLIVLGLFALGVLVVGIVAAVVLPRMVERRVIASARERGIELTSGDVSFGLGWVQVSDANLALTGVHGLTVRAELIDVELSHFEPVKFTVNRVTAAAVAQPVVFLRELDAWQTAHSKTFVEPASIRPVEFTLRTDASSEPVLALSEAEISHASPGTGIKAKTLHVLGRDLGELRAAINGSAVKLGLSLGMSTAENPLLAIDTSGASLRTVHVALSPVALGRLGSVIGRPLPLPTVVLSGTADVSIPPSSPPNGRVAGNTDFTLKGYVPPHPVELDGFLFGDTTAISSHFTLEPEQLRVALEQTKVKSGRFELTGDGELKLEGDHGRLRLGLSGGLPCAALAGAVAESRLGRALGRVSGKAVREILSGAVGVHVAIDADTRDLDHAKVLKTISPGCGLQPLSWAELARLGELIPEAMDPKVLADMEKLIKAPLPQLPTLNAKGGLDVPGLGSVPLPLLQLPGTPGGEAPKPSGKPAASSKTPAKQPATKQPSGKGLTTSSEAATQSAPAKGAQPAAPSSKSPATAPATKP